MATTERSINLLAAVEAEVRARYAGFTDMAHGFEHVQRVYHLALLLAEQEHADALTVGLAALLHDLGRTTRGPARSHAERSAVLAKKLLASHDLPPETKHAVIHAIRAHSYRNGVEPETLEARVLYDADRLDSLGATGVIRWAMSAQHGHHKEISIYHPDDPFALWRDPDGQGYLLDRFFTKLLTLGDAMTTATGRAMAESRIAFLRLFLQELQRELAEGGSGYDQPEEFTSLMLWSGRRGGGQRREQFVEGSERGDVAIHRIYEEPHSA